MQKKNPWRTNISTLNTASLCPSSFSLADSSFTPFFPSLLLSSLDAHSWLPPQGAPHIPTITLLAPYLSHRLRKLDKLLSAGAVLGGAALGTAGLGCPWPGFAAVGASAAWVRALPPPGAITALLACLGPHLPSGWKLGLNLLERGH